MNKIVVIIVVVILVILGGLWLYSPTSNIDNQPFEAKSSDVNVVIPDTSSGYINDSANVLTIDQVNQIRALLDAADKDKNVQIAVLTLDSTSPLSIEEYGIRLGEKWKVGFKGADNGAIIIIAVKDRKVRIEVGSGLESLIPDSVAGDIIRNDMTPELKKGEWSQAIISGIQAIQLKVKSPITK